MFAKNIIMFLGVLLLNQLSYAQTCEQLMMKKYTSSTLHFDKFDPDQTSHDFQRAVLEAEQNFQKIITNPEEPTFDNTLLALDRFDLSIQHVMALFSPFASTVSTPHTEKLEADFAERATELENKVFQSQDLFDRINKIFLKKDSLKLNAEQLVLLEKFYQRFEDKGLTLSEKDRQEFNEISKKLATLSTQFEANVKKYIAQTSIIVTNAAELEGLSKDIIAELKTSATNLGRPEAWAVTLSPTILDSIAADATNRELREKSFRATQGKGLMEGANNLPIVQEMLILRHRLASLLGYKNYAEYVLKNTMAKNVNTTVSFMERLIEIAHKKANSDLANLKALAEKDSIEKLEPWDIDFYSKIYLAQKLNFDETLIQPYFESERVVTGVLEVAKRLYGLEFKKDTEFKTHHPDSVVYSVFDTRTQRTLGKVIFDLYFRSGKQQGAWMNPLLNRIKDNGVSRESLIHIATNFQKAPEGQPSLLSIRDVETVLHEVGHALHELFSDATYVYLTGTNVKRDFVELPSQLMENFLYERSVVDLFATHYKTGEKMPEELFQKMVQSRKELVGLARLPYYLNAILDLRLHLEDPANLKDIEQLERQYIDSKRPASYPLGATRVGWFTHVFSGGYAVGYYSYFWADILEAQGYAQFAKTGVLNRATGDRFRDSILSKGGTRPPEEIFHAFTGEAPNEIYYMERTGLNQ